MPSVTVDRRTFQLLLRYAACTGKTASAAAKEAITDKWENEGRIIEAEKTGKSITLPRMRVLRNGPNLLSFPHKIALPLLAILAVLTIGRGFIQVRVQMDKTGSVLAKRGRRVPVPAVPDVDSAALVA